MSAGGTALERRGRRRGQRHRDADPGDDERQISVVVAHRGGRDQGDPGEPGRLQHQPEDHQRPGPDPVGQRAGQRRDHDRGRRPGQEPQPGAQRREAKAELEVLRGQEGRREQRRRLEEPGRVGGGEGADPQQPPRQHRFRRPPLPGREPGQRGGRRGRRARRPPWSLQPDLAAPHQAPQDASRHRRSPAPRRVGRAWCAGPAALRAAGSPTADAAASPIGTLTQKIQCQLRPCTTAPPTSGPAATASPAMPPQMPTMAPRRSAGKAAVRMVRLSGVTIAAPMPCTARAAISGAGARRQRAGGGSRGERSAAPRRRPGAARAGRRGPPR